MIGDIRGIAVRQDELPAASERDAAEFQTSSCIENPEQGVIIGRGTVLLTISVSVIIIKQYLVFNREGNMGLWTSYEMVESVDQLT
jgi:hypothetical protein